MTRASSVMPSTIPCTGDDNNNFHAMMDPWVGGHEDLLDNGITIGGEMRAVRLFLEHDRVFFSSFIGHEGASARMPCTWFPAGALPSRVYDPFLAALGHLQAVGVHPVTLRTRAHL